jgi:hypothetical protein
MPCRLEDDGRGDEIDIPLPDLKAGFAETKEQLTGYFVFECDNLDQALALAARIPGARDGAIEVRPLLDMDADM